MVYLGIYPTALAIPGDAWDAGSLNEKIQQFSVQWEGDKPKICRLGYAIVYNYTLCYYHDQYGAVQLLRRQNSTKEKGCSLGHIYPHDVLRGPRIIC